MAKEDEHWTIGGPALVLETADVKPPVVPSITMLHAIKCDEIKTAEVEAVPVGSVMAFTGDESKLPAGFVPCDGRELKSADYPALHKAIAGSWGEDKARGVFTVPDMRGRTPKVSIGGKVIEGIESVEIKVDPATPAQDNSWFERELAKL
jgi:hypothetical protein